MEKKKIYEYIIDNKLEIEEIIKEYSNYVYSIINKESIFNVNDIEELISDVFFTLWKNQNKLNINNNITSYIAGITKNLILKKYRDINTNYKYEYLNEKIEEFCIDCNFELYSGKDEKYDLLISELKKIKNEIQKIFIMYYFENKKIKDIAIQLNYSESKVKMQLNRTRKKLRKFLIKRGYNENEWKGYF